MMIEFWIGPLLMIVGSCSLIWYMTVGAHGAGGRPELWYHHLQLFGGLLCLSIGCVWVAVSLVAGFVRMVMLLGSVL